ncbi:MAG: hypothetical protein AAF066_11245 [Pseudomonadota bacterium]
MTAALAYFIAMLAFMVPLIGVHVLCIVVTGRHNGIMPDNGQRWRYQRAEGAMAATCVAMLWYMGSILDIMVTFCASYPIAGLIAHLPWIIGTGFVLVFKTHHLMRLIEQVKEL